MFQKRVVQFFSAGLAALICMPAVAQIPQKDLLECVLPNGDKFILESGYLYTVGPLSRHGSSRHNQDAFSVYYQPNGAEKWREPIDKISHDSLRREDNRQALCAHFLISSGVVNTPRGDILPGEKTLKWLPVRYSKKVNEPASLADADRQKLLKIGLDGVYARPQYRAMGMVDGRFVLELVMLKKNDSCDRLPDFKPCPVQAVWQSVSADNGASWSEPELQTTSAFFQMGKTWFEQPGVAKVSKYRIGLGD